MSAQVIIDEGALEATASSISTYLQGIKSALDNAIIGIQSNGVDWNDEDFDNLLSAISSFMADVGAIDAGSTQILNRINEKIEQIKRLRGIKI